MKYQMIAAVLMLTTAATPAFAQEEAAEGPISFAGSVALVSDYRFRGVSQTDEGMAIQGGISVSHESGFYVGTWGSNLAGWGTFGGSSMELDIYGGYAATIGAATVDVGLTWYMYPDGLDTTDFAEAYVKLSGDLGPVSGLVGVAYAPSQEALGNWSNTPQSAIGDKEDNLYIWTDISGGIPNTPVTLKAHLGYSDGNPGLGPNGTSIAPTGTYWDWMIGADVAVGPVTLGLAYIDTSISNSDRQYLVPNFSNTEDGGNIAGSRVVASLSASF
jgi:uncharacterized protein (TIGR02001 family)